MRVISPQEKIEAKWDTSIFLGGTIGISKVDNWRDTVKDELKDIDGVVLFDPVVTNWNQTRSNKENTFDMKAQINWELEAQEKAEFVVYYFSPTAKASITFTEMGLFATTRTDAGMNSSAVVCCPTGFWKKNYIDVFCARYKIETADTLDELCKKMRSWVE